VLREHIVAIAGKLPAGARVLVEVHSDGSGQSLDELARTQREAVAVAKLFAAAGIAPRRIEARGRGALEPLENSSDPAARLKNRRIAIAVQLGSGPLRPVPRYLVAPSELTVEGKLVELDSRGRFWVRPQASPRESVLVDIQCADGRRAAIDAPMGHR
jgi:hypothetical protein